MMMELCSYSGMVELDGEIRLDRYASEHLKLLSRSQIKSRAVEAKVNGKRVKISRPVKAGDNLELSWLPAAPVRLEAENIPLDIIYEDDRSVVINKAQGMVVHPGAGNPSGTLANALLWRKNRREMAETAGLRYGIVHRLDKDTSGVIIAAYDDESLAMLSAQFKARTVKKHYLAMVPGCPQNTTGIVYTRLVRDFRNRKCFAVADIETGRGKPALTHYRVLKSWGDYSFLLLRPRSGRTHQLRVHLKCLGHPILGDPLYGRRDRIFPQASLMLHAHSLAITLPGGEGPSLFKAPLPERFKAIISTLDRR
jgi:23S rRNA pseudouridine1911/1915/1917 synthase